MEGKKQPVKANSTRSYRLYFTLLFLIFGAIIAILTSVINYKLDVKNINHQVTKAAKKEVQEKLRELASYIGSMENYVTALRNNPLLHDFALAPTPINKANVTSLFLAIARTNPDFMQVRFLDSTGRERIRIDRTAGNQAPEVIPDGSLQDKSHRYYFIESSQVLPNMLWYSKIDLNVENKQIEVPYKPVLRVASPVYVDQKFMGVVIFNAHTKAFLNSFKQSPLFNISIIDKEGEFIVHHDDEKSWSKYLQSGYTIFQDQPEHADEILHHISAEHLTKIDKVYLVSLKYFLSQDEAALIMSPRKEALQALHSEQLKATFVIIFIICFLSIPLALLLSKLPSTLNRKISAQTKVLTEYIALIDENIITSTSDQEDTILEVSSAFTRTCGYSKEELIGRPFRILRHEKTPAQFYQDVNKIIKSGQIWRGEIRHRGKEGNEYWTQSTICPNLNGRGEITVFTAIHQDITDRKNLETISVTDELTGLYNRRFFNTTIELELKRSQRSGQTLSFCMLDVDHFKQYNDHYGHQKGDAVLTTIGQTLQKLLGRASDNCFRLGGEEFGVIFIDLGPEQGSAFARKILAAIESLGIEHQWSKVAPVITVSMGLLSVTPGPGITVDEIYKMADDAMYSAKQSGRNQVVSSLLNARV